MTGSHFSPTRERVAAELARLRASAGISGRAMAAKLGVSQPTISRTESADRLPSRPLAEAWLDAVGADRATRENLLALVEMGHSETVAYRRQVRQHPHLQGHVAELEAQTRRLRSMNPVIVHGLLQEPTYTRLVMQLADSENLLDQVAAQEARSRRQELLLDESRAFCFVMLESVARAPLVTAAQRRRLVELATGSQHIIIGIVPFDAPWPALPWNEFNLYDLHDDSRAAIIELTHGEATVTGEDDVALYERLHDAWLDAAVVGAAAVDLIRRG